MSSPCTDFDELLADTRKIFQKLQPGPECPPEDVLFDYVNGDLADHEHNAVESHIRSCESCQVKTLEMDVDRIEWESRLENDPEGLFAGIFKPENADTETVKETGTTSRDVSDIVLKQLKAWFKGVFSDQWFPADALMDTAMACRGTAAETAAKPSVERAKVIKLGSAEIAIQIGLTPLKDQEVDVCLEAFPKRMADQLPANMQIQVIDQTETIFMWAKTDKNDKIVRLTWIREPGDHYRLRLVLDNTEVEEVLG